MKVFFGIILLIFMLGCTGKKKHYPNETELQKLFQLQTDFKVISSKLVNIDSDKDLETLLVIEEKDIERILILKKNGKDSYTGLYNFPFRNDIHKDLSYSKKLKKWITSKKHHSQVIKRILVESLAGDDFNSLFVEVLQKKSDSVYSNIFAYRQGKCILDGEKQLKDHPLLLNSRRVSFTYISREKSIQIFPKDPSYAQELVFNGREMLPKVSGIPIPAILEIKTRKVSETELEVFFQLKNRGSYSFVSYLSLHFPAHLSIKVDSKNTGLKIYNKGEKIYSISNNSYIPNPGTLLEITKEQWGQNYKHDIKFIIKNNNKSLTPHFLFRLSTKGPDRQIVNIPNEFSSVETETDPQGFQSYKIIPEL